MSFLIPLIGAVIGAVAGFSLGGIVHAGYGGIAVDMRYPLLAVGILLGYFIGRMVARKPTGHNDGPDKS